MTDVGDVTCDKVFDNVTCDVGDVTCDKVFDNVTWDTNSWQYAVIVGL